MLWAVSITFVRLGLLFFYKKVFPTPKFKLADNILIIFTICWSLTAIIVSILAFDFFHICAERAYRER